MKHVPQGKFQLRVTGRVADRKGIQLQNRGAPSHAIHNAEADKLLSTMVTLSKRGYSQKRKKCCSHIHLTTTLVR